MLIGIAMAAAVVAAFACIAALIVYFCRTRTPKFCVALYIPGFVGLLFVPQCFFLSVVVGGNIGGAFGDSLSLLLLHGESTVFIVLGIAIGMWLVFTAPEILIIVAFSLLVLRPRAST